RPHRHEIRLRSVAVWRLHGAPRRQRGPLVRHARIRRRRQEGDDDRRAVAELEPRAADRMDRRAGAAVRLLPERPDHVRRGAPLEDAQADRRTDRHRDERQHLPVRHVSTHPPRHQARGRRAGIREGMMNLNRRTFLKTTTAVGGGLMIGSYLALDGADTDLLAAGTFEPNIWLKVNSDDTVRIMLSQLEMGQGVMTSMPMLVAEELDVDWSKVKIEWTPADAKYGNPNFGGQQLTAGSNSVRGMWKILRESGASARAMLVSAAAQTWNVPDNSLTTEKGEVVHRASGRRVKYGALVDKAATLPVPKNVALKDPKDFKILGQSLPRLDIPAKVDGKAEFGLDVKRPGMLIARVVKCPVFGGKVASFNADKARAVPGVRNVVQITSGVAVVADTYWAASKGAQALEVKWNEGALATLNSADISRKYAQLAEQTGKVARNEGDADAAIKGGGKSFERVFEAPFLAHATMEPMNCTADVQADKCDVWVPTQGQTASHMAAIAASGLPANKVNIHTTYLGGGFGRRGEADFVTDAVETSKAVGKPVKVVWTREDDMQHDYYRPVTYLKMSGAV